MKDLRKIFPLTFENCVEGMKLRRQFIISRNPADLIKKQVELDELRKEFNRN